MVFPKQMMTRSVWGVLGPHPWPECTIRRMKWFKTPSCLPVALRNLPDPKGSLEQITKAHTSWAGRCAAAPDDVFVQTEWWRHFSKTSNKHHHFKHCTSNLLKYEMGRKKNVNWINTCDSVNAWSIISCNIITNSYIAYRKNILFTHQVQL